MGDRAITQEFEQDRNMKAIQRMREDEQNAEDAAYALVRAIAVELAGVVGPIWHHGDGFGGSVLSILNAEFESSGFVTAEAEFSGAVRLRKDIPASLRTAVYERDEYRCVECGTFRDLSVDHIFPVSKGGTNEFENLRTLCKPCNSRKGAR